jgi:hypothetical protein
MGIVTWANLKIEFRPEINKTFFVTFKNIEEGIAPIYRIQRLRMGQECFLINCLNLAVILSEGDFEKFENLRNCLPPWSLILILSGLRYRPHEKIAYEESALMKMRNEEFPNLSITTSLAGVPGGGEKLQTLLRKPWPVEELYWKHFFKDGCEDLFFVCRASDAGKLFGIVQEVAARYDYPMKDAGCYLQPIEYARACHFEFNFYYEPGNASEIEKVKNIKMDSVKALMSHGAFFSRPYGETGNIVFAKASSYTTVLKKIKGLFDPNNIMNPGNLCF